MENMLSIILYTLGTLFILYVLFLLHRLLGGFKALSLEAIETIKIGQSYQDAVELYGEPSEPNEEDDEEDEGEDDGDVFIFDAGPDHKAKITFIDNQIIAVNYCSDYSFPRRDLKFILKQYSEGIGWREYIPGFSFIRKDNSLMVNCSAAPMICVMRFPPNSEEEE